MDQISLTLPWPPSVNRLWRMGKGNWYSTSLYKNYQKIVYYSVNLSKRIKFDDKAILSVTLYAYPPDKRKRDLDGLLKAVLDSLQHSGLFKDDSMVKRLFLEMRTADPEKKGKLLLTIETIKY